MTTAPTGRDFYPHERRTLEEFTRGHRALYINSYAWEECGWLDGRYYTTSAEKAAIERSLRSPPQDQPAQLPAPGEDPAVELQRSFFEIPGFMQPPQRGGS